MIPVPAAEAVDPVGQVDAVRGPGDDEEEQHVPAARELTFQCTTGMKTWSADPGGRAKPTPTVICASRSSFQRPRKPSERGASA
jgi:hypothetical protein